jgi:hypothetical protein
MLRFPAYLTPNQISSFPDHIYAHELNKLRSKIYDFILSQTKGGIDLRSSTDEKGQYSFKKIDEKIINQVCNELSCLGWETRLAFGKTTLFVFNPTNIPEEVKNLPSEDSIETIE